MEDIRKKDYARFMEQTLREMMTLPVEGICVITKLEGGSTYTSYFNSPMIDKLTYAGIIQQDAMLETLRASGMILSSGDDAS
ncbi:MAG: hypothetical protein IKU68_00435 [Oscillospiraceae bacterium]|nr:hypothetical protein [Oscillospiraceae bacterium]